MLPALTVGVFCLAVGGDPSDLRLGLVNFETSSCLNSDDNYSQVNCTPPTELSCHFINSVDQNIMTFVSQSIVIQEYCVHLIIIVHFTGAI